MVCREPWCDYLLPPPLLSQDPQSLALHGDRMRDYGAGSEVRLKCDCPERMGPAAVSHGRAEVITTSTGRPVEVPSPEHDGRRPAFECRGSPKREAAEGTRPWGPPPDTEGSQVFTHLPPPFSSLSPPTEVAPVRALRPAHRLKRPMWTSTGHVVRCEGLGPGIPFPVLPVGVILPFGFSSGNTRAL